MAILRQNAVVLSGTRRLVTTSVAKAKDEDVSPRPAAGDAPAGVEDP